MKSVRAHIELQTVATCGFANGWAWSSAWIGWAVSPGASEIDASEETQALAAQDPLDQFEHLRLHGHLLPDLAVGQQVVRAGGAVALEAVVVRRPTEVAVETVHVGDERIDQVVVDEALDDGEALLVEFAVVHAEIDHDHQITTPAATGPCATSDGDDASLVRLR